jgi:hypothetical protein
MLKHQCRAKFRFPEVEHPEDPGMIDAFENTELAHRHAAEALSLIGRCSTRVRISKPRITTLRASSGNGRCSAFALSHGAHPNARSSSVVRITGMAFAWIGSTTAFGDVVRNP